MIKKKGVFTKSLAFSMALAMTVTNLPANLFSSVTDSDLEALSNVSAASTEYGLADDIDDGVILHAWNWSFDQIKAELPKIAAAGFTSIQTSPAQPNKDGNSVSKTSQWWKFYQPTDFTIGNKLGTKTDLTELCKEADKYGIKIIVDVVANHLANNTGKEGNSASDRSTQIPDWIRNNNNFWHSDNFSGSSDGNRYQMTRGPIGMPDLNTANSELQDYIIKYLNDLQDCGVDGFRFDAAKHIETPSDSGFSSKFWSKVKSATQAKDSDVFLYGEILNTAGPGGYSDVQKYTPYIKVTNNLYGHSIQSSVGNWNAGYAKTLSGYNSNGQNIFGTNGNEWVLWNESHDTYAGDYGDKTNGYSDEQMTMAWCAVAARYSTALYYVRPTGDSNWGSSALGSHKMTYTDERIGAMNRFHNYFADQKEYASTSDNVLVVERGTTGVALINYNRGSKQVSIKMNRMVDGTYKDQISGNTFTVSNGVLTGKIGSGGVAAIYNAEPVATEPNATISKEGGNFSTDTLELTVGLKNATSGTYQIGNGSVKTFTSSKTITIGADMSYGDSVTVKLTATDGKNNYSKSYTFTKVEQTGNVAYLSLPSGWGSTVYCYAYDSATGKINNGTWPGQKMKKDSETGYYVYEVPENIEKPRVIFYNSDSNRTPGSMEDGYLLEEEGSYLYKDGKWSQYTAPVTNGTVTVKYVDENGNAIASAEKLTGKVGTSYSTSAVTVAGYTLSNTPANAKGTFTKSEITVTYVYKKEECKHSTLVTKNAQPASCTKTGYTGDAYCADCDVLVSTGTVIPALGHSWDAGIITKQPTATESGIRTYTCSRCGTTRQEVIAPIGCTHSNTVVKNAKAATCTEAGYTGDTYCAACNVLLASGTTKAALGHSWNAGVVTKQPTATETGIRTYTCNTCGTTRQEIIPVLTCNHCLEVRNHVASTCTDDGYSGDVFCAACDTLLYEGQDVPATGHAWDDGVVTVAPTATEDGVMTYSCANCSETVTEPVPATGEEEDDEEDDDEEISDELEVGDTVVVDKATYKITKLSDSTNTVEYVASNSKATTIAIPKTVKVEDTTFKVTSIANGAFKGNTTVKKITIGSNVTKIGNNAFKNCKKLTTVAMGSNVNTIGTSAFYNCVKLTNISIPANVKKIGKTAFYNCKKLKKITINSKKLTGTNVGAKAFKNTYAKVAITVPESKLTSYKTILKNKGVNANATIAGK